MGEFVYILGSVGLSNVLSSEAGSFSHHCNPHRCFQSEVLRLYFLALEPWVAWSVSLPSVLPGLSTHECGTACSTSRRLTQSPSCCLVASPLHPAAHLCPSYQSGCFFNSLFVGFPYSLIFCQFWLFFVLKFVVVLWLYEEAKVYLPMLPS